MKVIHILRKPLSEGTVAANTLKHGTGGLNIEGCRVSTGDDLNGGRYAEHGIGEADGSAYGHGINKRRPGQYKQPSGRWPANVILQHLEGCRCEGVKRVRGTGTAYEPAPKAREHMIYGDGRTLGRTVGYADEDGKETVANWICEPGCPVAKLDEQSGQSVSHWSSSKGTGLGYGSSSHGERGSAGYNDTGGASRFYKQVGGEK